MSVKTAGVYRIFNQKGAFTYEDEKGYFRSTCGRYGTGSTAGICHECKC